MKKVFWILFLTILLAVLLGLYRPVKNEQTVIKFSSWGSQSELSILLPLIKEFEDQNQNVRVEFIHIPQSYFQKLHLLFASGLAPDVVFLNNYYLPKYAQAGLLEDLTIHIDKSQYFEKAIEALSYDGKVYAVPRDVSDIVVYYNKKLFDKYKIPYPREDWTITDFIKIGESFASRGVWGTGYETDMIYWYPFLLSNNGDFIDFSTKSINNTNKTNEMLNLYSDLANKYRIAPKKSDSANLTMAQLFLQERLAMHISGRWLVPKYRQEAEFDWDIMIFPSGKAGSVVNIDASGYALSKYSKNKEIALNFIKFISSEKSLEKLTKSGLIVPANKEVAFSNVFLDINKCPRNAKVFLDTIESGVVTPVFLNQRKILDILDKALEPLFLGKIDAQHVFTDELLEKLNQHARD